MPDNEKPVLFDGTLFADGLISTKVARGRQFAGFSEIRIRQTSIEADYVLSNGAMSTNGTFTMSYKDGDNTHTMVREVNKALGDAFKKFERMKP